MPGMTTRIDTIIVGGGIAGLWLLNVLRSRGYSAVLFESDSLGSGQTLASQGIVHGGIKYALGGALTAAGEAMSQALPRWRACLDGVGEVDLRGLELCCSHFHLFTGANTLDRLSAFFASKALRGRVERLDRHDYPEALRDNDFRGSVYRLEDFVLDTTALVERLGALAAGGTYRHTLTADACTLDGNVQVRFADCTLTANRLILAAGADNDALLEGLGLSGIAMQRRPLHQVIVRHPKLAPLYAHWLAGAKGSEPRFTITSHYDADDSAPGSLLWHLGGRLSTGGIERSSQQQCRQARLELETCFPWMDWSLATFETWRIDRAEPRQRGGVRPNHAFAEAVEPCIVCWPTKLTLAPDLGDRVLSLLPPPEHPSPGPLNLPAAAVGRAPWGA